MARRKHSPNFLRDVRFYLRNRHRFAFTGSNPVTFDYDPHGADGLTAYKRLDSNGVKVPTKHPLLAQSLAFTKASVNWQIKDWKAGAKDHAFFVHELRHYLASINAPDWVYKALEPHYLVLPPEDHHQ